MKKSGFKIGTKFSPEHREKIRLSKLGKKASEETKKKMSLKRKGIKFSDEHKDKIKKALTGMKYSEDRKRKIGKANTGKKRTLEQLDKIRGKNHHCWKGGISDKNLRLRATYEYQQWRLKVYIRDNFTCQCCGQVGKKLNAHHIKSFAKYPKLRFNIDNGITLCVPCHKMTDNFAGKNK